MLDDGLQDAKGGFRHSLDGFALSPSDEPQTLESEQILHNSFKAAAVSITQMYRESQKLRNQCLIEGYEQCLRDIWTYTAVSAQRRAGDQVFCGLNAQTKLTVEVTDLLTALTKRLAVLQGPRIQSDKEAHAQRRQDGFPSQGRISVGVASELAQRQKYPTNDHMDVNNFEAIPTFITHNSEQRYSQSKCEPSEEPMHEQQPKKRRSFNSSDIQLDPAPPRYNRQYAFLGNRNSHLFHDSLQRKVKSEKYFDS